MEGTDGSGKKVQTKLLAERFLELKKPVYTASLPQYGKKSAGPSEEYLNGKYGDADAINPYAAAVLYASDNFDLSYEVRAALAEGKTVIMDRYVDFNVGHQGGKIKDEKERKKFLDWLYDLEYRILGLPKPDAVFVLAVPAAMAQQMSRLHKDIHEKNLAHLMNAEAAYRWLTKLYPDDHFLVECVDGNQLLPPSDIHEKIYSVLKEKQLV